jgi:GT2 family glycosyltransferase
MELSIIIVSYNVRDFLAHCLCSVMEAIEETEAEIIVVDNNSNDDTVNFIEENFPSVLVIANVENVGFSKANNMGVTISKGSNILFLNPDTLITKTTIHKCLDHFYNVSVGAVGVRMLDGKGNFLPESKRSKPTAMACFFKLCGLAALFPSSSFFNKYALGNIDGKCIHAVDVLPGAFVMIKREIIKKLKGFDEGFFMYGEDIDLSCRILNEEYKNIYDGGCAIIHFKGESTDRNSKKYYDDFFNAMKIYINKHYASGGKMFKAVLKAGIITAKIFHQVNKKTSREQILKDPIIISSEIAMDSITKMMKRLKLKPKQILLPSMAGNIISEQILFLLGEDFDYAHSIWIMQKLGTTNNYYWYNAVAKSIIGSNNKHTNGTVIPTLQGIQASSLQHLA